MFRFGLFHFLFFRLSITLDLGITIIHNDSTMHLSRHILTLLRLLRHFQPVEFLEMRPQAVLWK